VLASLLGVAGGEFLIPTLVLLFGADVKLAGSLSMGSMVASVTFEHGLRHLGIEQVRMPSGRLERMRFRSVA